MIPIVPGKISIDYEAAIQKSNELKAIASDCYGVADSVSRLNAILEGAWKGQSGQEMLSLCNRWMTKEKTLGQKMETVAAQIKTVADSIKAADEAAAARNRA